jgi:hypothetical protein
MPFLNMLKMNNGEAVWHLDAYLSTILSPKVLNGFQYHWVLEFYIKMYCLYLILVHISNVSRPQWPRGLRHELSSSSLTVESWVNITITGCVH